MEQTARYKGGQRGLSLLVSAGVALGLASWTYGQCTNDCGTGDVDEGEACLADEAVDDTNGGCNSDPVVFGPGECSVIICGTASTYDEDFVDRRDTDWYLVDAATLAAADKDGNGVIQIRSTVTSEFPAVTFFLSIGDPLCAPVSVVGTTGFSDPDCAGGDPSEYVVILADHPNGIVAFVAPGNSDGRGIFDGVECELGANDYILQIECIEVATPEACTKDAGPCNEPDGTPGCDIELCCALVCNVDPFCCAVEWNQTCVDIAAELPQCIVIDAPEGFFLDPAEFNAALNKAGKVAKGTEDFPWEGGPNGVIGADDPLDVDTSIPGWIQPGILLDNVTYQANVDPFGANGPNPRGGFGLALFTTGFIGATHNGVVANHFMDSLDILSGPPAGDNHTAMAMTLISFNNETPGGTVTVTVYDKDENVLGAATNLPAPVNGGLFLGLLFPGDVTISRVNLYDTTPGFDAEGVYDLTVYVLGEPDPCPWDLDGNNDIGVGDLLILLGAWGPNPGHPADFDGNDNVDVSDLLTLLANWGPCP